MGRRSSNTTKALSPRRNAATPTVAGNGTKRSALGRSSASVLVAASATGPTGVLAVGARGTGVVSAIGGDWIGGPGAWADGAPGDGVAGSDSVIGDAGTSGVNAVGATADFTGSDAFVGAVIFSDGIAGWASAVVRNGSGSANCGLGTAGGMGAVGGVGDVA